MQALQRLAADFHASDPWLGLLLLAACLATAWLLARRLGRHRVLAGDSVWFGTRLFDGLMLPLLALALVYLAKTGVELVQPVFVLRVAVPVLLSLVVVRLCARVLLSVFPQSALSRAIERFVWWGAWLGTALWVTGLLPPLLAQLEAVSLTFGKTRIDLRTLLEGAVSAGLMLVVTLWVSAALERRILASGFTDLSLRKASANVARAALLLVGLLFVLSTIGVDLTALSVFGGAIGVGLGLGLQKLASNYISGYVMLLERSLHIGDNIRIDAFEGRITDIKTRYTLVRATNGREAIVPNENFITQRVENLSAADLKFRLFTEITVGYDSDVEQVRVLLAAAAASQDRVLTLPEPVAHLLQFAPDGLLFALNYWIADPAAGQDNLRSDVNRAALAALRQAGVELPYPQRVVHMTGKGDGPPA